MNKLKDKFLWLLILMWVGIDQVYWRLSPSIANYNSANLHTSALQVLHSLTLLGPTIFLILLGTQLRKQKDNVIALTVKTWLNTFALGTIACLIVSLCSRNATPKLFYDSFFPLLRNTYPLIFASMFGLFLGKLSDNLTVQYQRYIPILIWGLVFVSSFSTPNMFGWADGANFLFYALMVLLGWRSFVPKLTLLKWFSLATIAGFGNAFLQAIMPFFSIDGTTIGRFTTSFNFLAVLTAFALAQIVKQLIKFINLRITFSYLTLIENTAIIAYLAALVDKQIGHSSFKLAVLSLGLVLVGIIIAQCWTFFLRISLIDSLSKKISHFFLLANKKQQRIAIAKYRELRPTLCLSLLSYMMALTVTLLMNTSWQITPNVGPSYNIFAYTLGQREMTLALTTLIIFASIKFIQALTNRYWIGLFLVMVFNVVLVIANKEKIAARNEPILPADLAMLSVAKQLLGMVDLKIWLSFAIFLILLIFIITWLEIRRVVAVKFSRGQRIFYLLFAPLIFLSSTIWNQPNTPINNFLSAIDDQPMFYNQLSGAKINGPILQYLNNVDVTVMKQPSGYSQKAMVKIVQRYGKEAAKINETRENHLDKQTIIFNLSESFANPNRVPGVKLKNNPIPFVTKMEKQGTGGTMISSGYGGGTANMEYMTLTGFTLSNFSPTLPTPYTQLVPTLKNNPSIVQSFRYATAIHPYIGAFYSRITVYHKFGFNKFMYLGSKDPIKHRMKIDRSPYLSDKTSYDNALDQIREHDGGQFINLVTMQNHFPYDQNYYDNLARYEAVKVSAGTNINAVNDFTTGIHYTDKYLRQFISQLDEINKPITIVFYGDHLPGIYGNDMKKDGVKLHETDYFIYSNKYAREHGAKNFEYRTKYVVPNDFIAMVAKQTNSKVDWYQALLTNVYEQIPAMTMDTSASTVNAFNSSTHFIGQSGHTVKEKTFTKKQKQFLHDYKLIQYDVTAGKHYTSKYFN